MWNRIYARNCPSVQLQAKKVCMKIIVSPIRNIYKSIAAALVKQVLSGLSVSIVNHSHYQSKTSTLHRTSAYYPVWVDFLLYLTLIKLSRFNVFDNA